MWFATRSPVNRPYLDGHAGPEMPHLFSPVNPIKIPDAIIERLAAGLGKEMTKINNLDPLDMARDMLNPQRALTAYALLDRHVDPKGKQILEIGSGYGTNLIVWTKHFGLDVIGVEPEGGGFSETISISEKLCELNGVPPDRIKVSTGEALPFVDSSFDIVYSANVLEHTNDPAGVLREALRVLRPGGILHFEIPNFLSFFEGHYYVLMPPIWWKGLLPFWVKHVYGRDPAFAKTLRTEINPIWLRRTLRELGKNYPLQPVSLGEELFRERLNAATFEFAQQGSRARIGPLISLLLKLNKGDMVANSLILLQAHYPLYLTVRKTVVSGGGV